MRSILLLLFCLLTLCSQAQHSSNGGASLKPTSIVRDLEGNPMPVSLWRQLLIRGDFGVRAVDPQDPDTEFQLYQLTELEKAKRLASLKKPESSPYFKPGQKFRAFKTTDMAGNPLNPKTLQGKILVINFWFINCPPCRMEIPELNALVDSFSKSGKVAFIAVALDRKDQLEVFLRTMPFKYNIVDAGSFIAEDFGIQAFPTHVIVDTDGKIAFSTTGFGPNTVPWIRKSIAELID